MLHIIIPIWNIPFRNVYFLYPYMRNKTIHTSEYQELIKKLIQARKEANFTQQQVAKKLGCSQSYVSKIENCQIRLDPVQLKNFSKIYHVEMMDLLE